MASRAGQPDPSWLDVARHGPVPAVVGSPFGSRNLVSDAKVRMLRPVGTPDGGPGRHATPGRLNRPRSWRGTFLPRAALGPTSTEAVRRADETVMSPSP